MTKAVIKEAPMDFVRGASRAVGDKFANSSLVRTGKEIAQAGSAASLRAEVEKSISVLAKLLGPELTGSVAADAEQTPAEVPAKKKVTLGYDSQQQARNTAADAAPASAKYQSTPAYNYRSMQFGEFMQTVYSGEQLDEGIWDFMKGAGQHASTAVRNKINDYAKRPSMFHDIYQAGANASKIADDKAAKLKQQKQAQAQAARDDAARGQQRQMVSRAMSTLLSQLSKMDAKARNDVMFVALRKLPPGLQQPLWNRIREAAKANGIAFGTQ